jgi:hypothetical protein
MSTTAGIGEKRPCCLMLRKLAQSPGTLKDPQAMEEAMNVLARHCVLMKTFGSAKVKWDLAKSDCFLAVSPDDAQTVADELGKTRAVNASLEKHDAMLAFMNGILSNNAVLKQIQDKNQVFLVALREGEKRFGRVPDTSLLKKDTTPGNELGSADRLKAHPLLSVKTQFDGVSDPKANANPKENPEAAQNQEQLQNQYKLQPKPQLTNAPSSAPKLRPGG